MGSTQVRRPPSPNASSSAHPKENPACVPNPPIKVEISNQCGNDKVEGVHQVSAHTVEEVADRPEILSLSAKVNKLECKLEAASLAARHSGQRAAHADGAVGGSCDNNATSCTPVAPEAECEEVMVL